MPDFTGRYAVVTGAGKGIGRAIAERFLQDHVEGLAILDWDETLIQATAQELDPTGERVLALKCDVSDEESVVAAFQAIFAKFGVVDILINNAGITRDAIFHKMDPAMMKKVMDVNYYGCYNCIRQVVPGMRERCYGRIVNISSTSVMGNPGQANYSASKAAIEGLTHTLAKELARKSITVNAIAPGYIETDMMLAVPKDILDSMRARMPMGRMGKPSELAAVAAFLASDDASYVSGVVLTCSGASIIRA